MFPIKRVLPVCNNVKVIFRSVNFQSRNPREPHFDRKRMLEVCKPIYLPEKIEEHLKCANYVVTAEIKPHPYEVILSKEVKENIELSKMTLLYHVNSLTYAEFKSTIRIFCLQNMSFHIYDTSVMNLALKGTKYQAILQLFDSSTGIVFSPEMNINEALKLNKKFGEKLKLLAGIIEDRLFSKSHLSSIGQVMKRNVHGEMLQQLGLPAASVTSSLSHHTNLLSHYLNELSKEPKE